MIYRLKYSNRCNREITEQDMDDISTHLGRMWRRLGRKMGYTNGNMDCIDEDNRHLMDKCYRILSDWRDREANAATVSALTKLLMEIDAFDAVRNFNP